MINVLIALMLVGISAILIKAGNSGNFGWLAENFPHPGSNPGNALEYKSFVIKREGHISQWNGFAIMGIYKEALIVSSIVPLRWLIPTFNIPLSSLKFVKTKQLASFYFKQFDQFEIIGTEYSIQIPFGVIKELQR